MATTQNSPGNLGRKYPDVRAIHLRPWATPSIVVGRATSHKRVGANAGQYPSPDPRRPDWPTGEGRVSAREIVTRLPISGAGPNVPTTAHSARPNPPTQGGSSGRPSALRPYRPVTGGSHYPPIKQGRRLHRQTLCPRRTSELFGGAITSCPFP